MIMLKSLKWEYKVPKIYRHCFLKFLKLQQICFHLKFLYEYRLFIGLSKFLECALIFVLSWAKLRLVHYLYDLWGCPYDVSNHHPSETKLMLHFWCSDGLTLLFTCNGSHFSCILIHHCSLVDFDYLKIVWSVLKLTVQFTYLADRICLLLVDFFKIN
jgi:hypothetical protein